MPNPVMKKRTVSEIRDKFVKGSASKKQTLKRLNNLADGESLQTEGNPNGSRRVLVKSWQQDRRNNLWERKKAAA